MTTGGEETERHPPEADEFDEALVEHSVRLWDAERENAARLSGRETLILSAIAAVFGLGLYRIDWFHGKDDVPRVAWGVARCAIKICLAGSLLCFAVAFIGLFTRFTFPVGVTAVPARGTYELARMWVRLTRLGPADRSMR